MRYHIFEHRSITPDNHILVIYDVYAGDDPRDYMMPGYRGQRCVASFRHRSQAQAYIEKEQGQ